MRDLCYGGRAGDYDEGWEIVIFAEVTAAGDGLVWLGKGESRIAIIQSVRAGILLRGDS